jgi:metal-responsive CopG/Arc/MetJ family transcriptional regulator
MKRFTISIPDELKKEIDNFPDINWVQIARESIEKKLLALEAFESFEMRREN